MDHKIGPPGHKPPEFESYIRDVSNHVDARPSQIEALKADAIEALQKNDAAAEDWKKIVAHGWGQEEALLALLREVSPWRHDRLVAATKEMKALAEVVHSFEGLCSALERAEAWPAEEQIDPKEARNQYMVRTALEQRIDRVRQALEAAGDCPATARFPKSQLDAIAEKVEGDIRRMEKARDGVVRRTSPMIGADAIDTPEKAARALADVLHDPKIEAAVLSARARVGDRPRFLATVAGFVRLADEATNAPDYALVGRGWFHPSSRRAYRERQHDGWTRWSSQDRQNASEAELKRTLAEALRADDPLSALEKTLVEQTIREIGADRGRAAEWNTNASAVRDALKAELFLPLRALNETHDGFDRGDLALKAPFKEAVLAYTEHVLSGDLLTWRYENPRAQHQLANLSDEQRALWKESGRIESSNLVTREEAGLEAAWVTKIGGPSHGFDYDGRCLLPFLSNARTKAILVEDPRWPHNAAARSYLRILHFETGVPTLYLEPLQRDFPHREAFQDPGEDRAFQKAILLHALEKADAMNLTLSLSPDLGDLMHELDLPFEHHYAHRYEIRASNGVTEASDTLTHKHDWPQGADEMTEGLERLLYVPEKLRH
jgi:hypothetical protein